LDAKCSVRFAAIVLRSNDDDDDDDDKEEIDDEESVHWLLLTVSGVETNAAPMRSPDIDNLTAPIDKLPSP